MKVAIVSDWLTDRGGAEKVLDSFLNIFPNAEIFTTVYTKDNFSFLEKFKVHTTWLNNLPSKIKKRHQILYPFLVSAIESLDLSGFDLVISSSSFVAKGVITDENSLHICYCHTPTRYFWDEWQYFLKEGLNIPSFLRPLKFIFPRLFTNDRIWDFVSAQRPDFYIGNSEYVVKRIKKYYERNSYLLRPPVDYDKFKKGLIYEKNNYYIAMGRLIPYKKFDLLIKTFLLLPNKKLKIVGKGPEIDYLKNLIKDADNIEILGFVEDKELIKLIGSAKAFLFPQNEDAGITQMEALSSGTPCIALNKGGSLGIVSDENGVLFDSQTTKDIVEAIEKFELKEEYFLKNRENISKSMEKYNKGSFEFNLKNLIDKIIKESRL